MKHDLLDIPQWSVAVTVGAYAIALWIRSRYPWFNPLFAASLLVVGFLLVTGIPYENYKDHSSFVIYMLGPATVALGVPIYKHIRQIGRHLASFAASVTIGALTSISIGWLITSSLNMPHDIVASFMPKSVTTAVSVTLSARLGGIPELTAILTVLTGLIGSMFGPLFLKLVGIRSDIQIGTAMGTASHGIGTARVVRDSELQGSISALAMGFSCIITPILLIPVYYFF